MALVDKHRNGTGSASKLEAQPLYARVKGVLIERLIEGVWKPGQAIPSEFAIADDLGVSQGTVRKALDAMTKEGLLRRKQGRGTFVAEAEDQSILFRFYRLTPNAGTENASFPDSQYLSQKLGQANEVERQVFGLDEGAPVWRFERLRSDSSGPILWEELSVPNAIFADFSEETVLPNNVYQFYGTRYGIIVAKVREELRATIGSPKICELLQLPSGSPLLQIERHAIALSGDVVERRVSHCRSDTMHYRNELR